MMRRMALILLLLLEGGFAITQQPGADPGGARPRPTQKTQGSVSAAAQLEAWAAAGCGAIPDLVRFLEAKQAPEHVLKAARILGRTQDKKALKVFERMMLAKVESTRQAAAQGLKLFLVPEAAALMLQATGDSSRSVMRTAVEALEALHLARVVPRLELRIERAVHTARRPSILTSFLTKMRTRTAGSVLRRLLHHRREMVRVAAIRALVPWKDENNARIIVPALTEGTVAVRKWACLYMGFTGYKRSVETLVTLLDDPDPGVRRNAHWALKQLTAQHLGPVASAWRTWWEKVGCKNPDY